MENKVSADRNQALKDRVRLPRDVMDRLLALHYVRHLNSAAEAHQMRRRWQA